MLVYINAHSGYNDFHNLQFTVNALSLDHAITKAERVIDKYRSGYSLNGIEATVKPTVHTMTFLGKHHMVVAKHSIHGRCLARVANLHGTGYFKPYSMTLDTSKYDQRVSRGNK